MIAALATILFLTVFLVLTGVAAMVMEESGAKIRATLGGRPPLAHRRTAAAPVRVSSRARSQRPVRAEARWRAAA